MRRFFGLTRRFLSVLSITLALLILCDACSLTVILDPASPTPTADTAGELSLTMIDVGNADCFLLQQGEHAMLIDAGEAGDSDTILSHLRSCGIKRLDLVIATHPHADHIGGMATVIEQLPIARFLMQAVPKSLVPTTACYRKMLEALYEKTEIDVIDTSAGGEYMLGEATVTVFPCLKEYDNLNDCSVVCRISYGGTAVLMMGDAQSPVEKALLESGQELSADVIKIGHHGSHSSSGSTFLKAVSPKLALIPCGADNSYGHPHSETLRTLDNQSITYYRADLCGTTTLTTDGDTWTVTTSTHV